MYRLPIIVCILLLCLIITLLVFFSVIRLCFNIPFVCSTDDRYMSRKYIQSDGIAFCITSGGCNPLDECLIKKKVYSCDYTVSQNYLLELKIATIKTLHYNTFWMMFGLGFSPTFPKDYKYKLRPLLSNEAITFWDIRQFYFDPLYGGLYNVGSLQVFISTLLCKEYWNEGYRSFVNETCLTPTSQLALVNTKSIQRLIKTYGWLHQLARHFSMTAVIDSQWKNDNPATLLQKGLERRASIRESFCHDYISRLYSTGSFSKQCCPGYMKKENYERLRLCVYRIKILKGNFVEALRQVDKATEIFPLDHMDCLTDKQLADEALEISRVTMHLPSATPIAVIKCVSKNPSYIHILKRYFEVKNVTDDLCYDGSDLYMVQSCYILITK